VTIGELDAAMGTVGGLVTYQVEQTAAGAYRVQVVPAAAKDGTVAVRVEATLQRLYGRGADVDVSAVSAVRPEPSGKYRLARALMPLDVYAFLEHRPEGL
jgi:hypothetical protein